MTILSWADLLAERLSGLGRPARLTVGMFDGLHLGHRRLIARVVERPFEAAPVVLTFRTHPALALGRPGIPGLILTPAQKLDRLAGLGVGVVVLIDFSDEIGTLSGRAFVELLRGSLAIERFVVGPDFRFGRDRDADVRALEAMLSGTETAVEVVPPVFYRGDIVSSSRIRRAISDGDIAAAREMLSDAYALDLAGIPVERTATGRLRVLRRDIAQVLPPPGAWEVTGRWDGGAAEGTLVVGGDAVEIRLETDASVASLDVRGPQEAKGARGWH